MVYDVEYKCDVCGFPSGLFEVHYDMVPLLYITQHICVYIYDKRLFLAAASATDVEAAGNYFSPCTSCCTSTPWVHIMSLVSRLMPVVT